MVRRTTLRVFDANLLFLIGSLMFFTIGYTVQQRELYTGLIITQLAVVLLPPILYLEIFRMDVRKLLRFNRISVKQGILAGLITVFMYPAAVTGNLIMFNILTRIGTIDIPEMPTATTPIEYIRLMLIVSLMAGVCEEVFFRGFVLSGYEKLGQWKAIIISAILFGMFHYNLYNLIGATVLGLVFGILVWATNSLYAGIIGHIVNNGLAITLGYVFNLMADLLPAGELELAEVTLNDSLLASLIFFGGLAVVGMGISLYLYRKLKLTTTPLGANQFSEPANHDVVTEPASTEKKDEEAGDSAEALGEQLEENLEEESVQWWEYFPLTGVIPLFIHVVVIQISMLLGRF